MIQLIATLVIVLAAIAYAAWRIYHALQRTDDPCQCCSGCSLHDHRQTDLCCMKGRKECPEKKTRKKFGRFK